MFKLVIQDDEGKTTVVPLIRDEITIGRKEGNTIRLTERNVSRRHARIVRNNGEVQIEDLGSYNGIRVNNARIAERVSLRVSDQVQIGDYKLYLKAEGVEQVDDARTMPIERIDAPATEVMPAVQAAPTAPMQAAAIPGTPAPVANRTAAATADTDPGGRPVATAAQVAALTQPTGYGKLVVISSNFAGKEFDLTRPQMIIGRTDENDLVINHRSISRNHAKVVRDTETNRYTISDLQSSNGVRVNGQDYGKVELRRGDTVDLGHVRLRFVEPGEDWIFSRDAVIADVPESGGNKTGLWIAIALLVLAGGAAMFFLFGRGGGGGGTQKTDNGGSNLAVASDQGSQVIADQNPGSNVAMVQTIDAAPEVQTPPPGDEAGRIKVECLQDISDKKWTDVTSCAERLTAYDKDKAKEYKAQARKELQNSLNVDKLNDAVRDQDLAVARKVLKAIDEDSVYRKDSEKKVDDLEDKIVENLRPQFDAAKKKNDCKAIQTALTQAKSSYGAAVAEKFAGYKCEVVATNPIEHPIEHPHPGNGSAQVQTPPPPASCDAEDLQNKGMSQEQIGQHGGALKMFEDAMKCKGANITRLSQLAFMASCNNKNLNKAKQYWPRVGAAAQNQLLQMCVRNGLTRDQLEGK